MGQTRRLLAASDFSPGAGRALARAVELAARHEAHLTVLHVVEPDAGPTTAPMLEARMSAANEDLFAGDLAPTAAVHVLHVADVGLEPALRRIGSTDAEIEAYRQERIEAGERDLARFLEEAGGEAAPERQRAPLETTVECGRPEAAIPAAVRRLRADLVVVGTRGRTASPRLLLGSVAEHVVRDARCDVLAVRPAPVEPWQPVAC